MPIRKFEQNDYFVNVIKTKPHCKFSIFNGDVFYKTDFADTVPKGHAALNDLNLGEGVTPSTCENNLDFSQDCNSQYLPLI